MIIKTKRLTLRPMKRGYLKSVCRYALDKEITVYMMNLPCDDEAEVLRYLTKCEDEQKKKQPMFFEFAVHLGNEHIGAASLYYEGSPDPFSCGELGWIFDKEFHGMGYATEAAQGIISTFHEKTGLRRFIAHCDSENAASARVMEKLGMKLVSVASGRKNRSSDELRQECMYELLLPASE